MTNRHIPSIEIDDYVRELVYWLREEAGVSLPQYRSVSVTESLEWRNGRILLGECAILDAYRPRFRSLMARGWAWINLNAVGIWRSQLLLWIEVPSHPPTGAPWTSVNLSGPGHDCGHGMRLDSIVDLEGPETRRVGGRGASPADA